MSRYLRDRSHSVQSESEEQEQCHLFAESPDLDIKMNSYNPDDDNHTANDVTANVKSIRIERPVMSLGVFTNHNQPKSTLREKLRKRLDQKCKCSPLTMLYSLMPIFYWLPRYNFKRDISFDLIAGFTIAVLQIPQGMAYALLGNLPPIIGMYMAFFPVLVYAVMGTSRHVSIGTFAVVCLMTGKVALDRLEQYHGDAATITDDDDNAMNYTELIGANITKYSMVEISAALSLCVGLWQILFGILQTGALSLLLSSDLISGFTTGAAFHVLTSQVRTILGLRLARRTGLFKIVLTYYDVFAHIHTCNVAAVIMSLITFAILCGYNELVRPIIAKKVKFPLPIELICIIVGTVASRQWDFHDIYSVSIVHTIPTGLPMPSLPPMEILPDLITDGLLIGVVSFAISISMIKIFSKKHGYEIDPNQELIAQGTSNAVGSLFNCAPISVSLSRSAIQDSMGGKTQLVGIFSAGLILIVLLWIGPFFETLPNCILSAIIIVALKGMFLQIYELPKAWKMSKLNGLIWILTAVSTVVLDVEYGLAIGMIISILILIWRSNVPTITVLGSFANLDIYTDISNTEAKEMAKIKIIKFTGSLNFMTVDHFIRKLEKIVPIRSPACGGRRPSLLTEIIVNTVTEEFDHTKTGHFVKPSLSETVSTDSIDHIILDLSSVSSMDPAAVKGLQQSYNRYLAANVQILLVGPPAPVLSTFSDCQVLKEIGLGKFFPTIHDAISFASGRTHV